MPGAKPLGCPTCEEHTSFDLVVTGRQEHASFQLIDGYPQVVAAQSVQVEAYDSERLRCRSCGTTVAEGNLVVLAPD